MAVTLDQATKLASALGANSTQLAGVQNAYKAPVTPSAPAPATITSPVVTGKAAENQISDIQAKVNDITSNMSNQAVVTRESQAQARLAADQKAKEQKDYALAKQTADAKTAAVSGRPSIVGTFVENQNGVGLKVTDDRPIGTDGKRKITYDDGSYEIVEETLNADGTEASYKPLGANEKSLYEAQLKKAEASEIAMREAQKISQQILDIQRGVIPLYPWQQAQVEGVANQFNQLIKQQESMNITASGVANVRGYQKGSAEYDPSFQNKVIGNIISDGAKKVSNLAVEAASAVSKLTVALRNDNVKAVKDAYDVFEKANKAHQDALDEVIKNSSAAIKDAQTALTKVQEDREKIAVEAAKNGAPKDVVNAIANAGSVADAVNAAGDYLQGGTGIVGEYATYKRDAMSRGQVPISFDDYQTRDANRKAAIARAGDVITTGGYTVNQEKYITSLNDAVSKSDTYKKTNSMRTYADNVMTALAQETGVGDIAAINQFQKVIDEGAVTRDQDVQLITSAQSVADSLKTKAANLAKGEKLSPELRSQMKKTVEDLYASQVKALEKDPYIQTKKQDAERNGVKVSDTILGQLGGFSTRTDMIQDEDSANAKIQSYITLNPGKSLEIVAATTSLEEQLGRPATAVEFLEAFPEYNE